MLNELNSGGKLCDLMIGDSQWIGGGAENGHYVKLNDFFDANGIDMADFIPATVTGYSEWPKNTPNYWALPAFGDVVGWTYRKDWFERPELQEEFQATYGRPLGVPATLEELQGHRPVLPRPRHRRHHGLWCRDLHRARVRRDHHGRDQRAVQLWLPV
jgi:multiple sugar transport system substrate-binding protein